MQGRKIEPGIRFLGELGACVNNGYQALFAFNEPGYEANVPHECYYVICILSIVIGNEVTYMYDSQHQH